MPVPTRFALAAIAAAVLVVLSTPQIRKPISRFLSFSGPTAEDHADERLPKINLALAAAKPGFVFLAGDSHAELMGDDPLCGSPIVNGGSTGANAKRYSSLLSDFDFKARPGKIVLIIGTNDAFIKNRPMEPRNLAEKVARIGSIVETLTKISSHLVMTPLPPILPESTRVLEVEALTALSQKQKDLCERTVGCQFIDPYREMRGESFGLALPGAVKEDGFHSADYGKVRKALEQAMCPDPVVTSKDASAAQPPKLH